MSVSKERMPKKRELNQGLEGVLLQEVGEELVILTPSLGLAYHLRKDVSAIYRLCDGKSLKSDVIKKLELGSSDALEIVLHELQANGLLDGQKEPSLSRREFMTKAASLGMALPVLTTISLTSPSAAQSGCAITTGTTGCQAAGSPVGAGGGASGFGPTGCDSCCGSGACSTCPGDCATCYCSRIYRCSNDGINAVSCSTAVNGDICQVGTTDFDPGLNTACGQPSIASNVSCSVARATAPSTSYRCCSCP